MGNIFWVILLQLVTGDSIFTKPAQNRGLDPVLLKGICLYESGGRAQQAHRNRNGTWDVGYCQNHRRRSAEAPRIPSKRASIWEGARELAKWKRVHNKLCVKHYQATGTCGNYSRDGRFRGVKNCHRPHLWFGHYNWGYRILKNNYDRKVSCLINNNFKRCKEEQWRKVKYPSRTKVL
jgi:hypothetical protein